MMVGKYTNMVLDMLSKGVLSPMEIAEMCLEHMNEDDVKNLWHANYLDDLISEEDEADGQPDEAQEWHDYDPDC